MFVVMPAVLHRQGPRERDTEPQLENQIGKQPRPNQKWLYQLDSYILLTICLDGSTACTI